MKLARFLSFGGLLLMAAIGRGVTSPPDRVIEPVGDALDTARFSFRVFLPALTIDRAPDGTANIAVDGYVRLRSAPGTPELPVSILRVAIPPGATPHLEVGPAQEDIQQDVVPRAVPRRIHSVRPIPESRLTVEGAARARDGFESEVETREVREPDAAIYGARETWPGRVAWLGETGAVRDQRYVEVWVAPVRFDPVLRGLRVARSLDLTVRFDGAAPPSAVPAPDDPVFETVYRESFVNYAQGKLFRGVTEAASAAPPEAPALAPVRAAPPQGTFAAAGLAPPAAPSAGGGPTYKIKVRANGVVRLDFARMSGTPFLAQPISSWKLTSRGIEVPLRVNDVSGNDLMDSGDWVQFYGQDLRSEPKTVLNTEFPGNPGANIYEDRVFSDENVYWLTVESGTRSRMAALAATPTMTRPVAPDFEGVSKQEVDDTFRPLAAADPWYWSPVLLSSGGGTKVVSVPLPGLASSTASARVRMNLRGVSEDPTVYPDHHTRVTLSNSGSQVLATNDDNGTFDGRTLYLHDFTWTWPGSGASLTDPASVKLEALPIASGDNWLVLDWVEIRYRRLFQASADGLVFDYPNGDAEFVVSGLSTSSPEIYEVTANAGGTTLSAPRRLTGGTVSGAGPYQVRFRIDLDAALAPGANRRFVVAGSGAVSIPANPDFTSWTPTGLRDTTIQASLIVIAHPSVLDQAPGAPLDQLLSLRASQGITSRVVRIADLEDEFGHGLYGPDAIRNFLRWVMSTNPGEGWANPKPAYVLILGDGSYDYKAATVNGNYVSTQILFKDDPSFGYYASDSFMAAVVGTDQLADLAVGRIPGRSVSAVNTVLQKIVSYEQSPPSGNWRRHAVFISDRGKKYSDNEAIEFENLNASSRGYMKVPPHTQRTMRYWTDYCGRTQAGCTPAKANQLRADIKASVNGTDGLSDGAAVVQYFGHGNFDVWSDDAFFDNRSPIYDTDGLGNGGRLPWLMVHTCLSGGFMTTSARTMGKDWINKTGGGSVAVLGPAGLGSSDYGPQVTDALWGDVYGSRKARVVATPFLDALSRLCGQGSIEPCQHYVLLGDPATHLSLPTVQPATSLSATGGHQQVTLTWTPALPPSSTYRFDVYRSTNPDFLGYTKANATPIMASSWVDTGLTNTTTYYYYVVALDGEGFESRWSNFNSDCAINGPDCVKAVPLNPNPPAPPTGLTVSDPETGGRLNLAWSANTESDLRNYDIHYRRDIDAQYTVINAAKATAYTLTGLEDMRLYYIYLTATNTSSRTSDPSVERTGTPTFVRGVRAPNWITSLRLDKSGSSIVLSWNAVTNDIYGKVMSASKYEIFRGTSVTFVPDATNKLGETLGTVTTFTDTGALSGGPSYYYLVRAVDASGNPGGLGGQLPNGTDAMTATRSTTPGNVLLSWPAVTTDFDGNPARIDHYEVYAAGTPVSRAKIRDGQASLVASTPGTSADITPLAGTQYYSVIVVDARGNKSSF